MPSWIDNLRDKERQAKLAREMTHTTRAPIESLRGQDPLTDWALGMRERTLSPLATLAGEAKRFQGLTPQEMGMELVGGGLAGTFAGVGAKTANLAQLGVAKKLKQAGVPDQEIHAQTGWTFGFADGKPRFEIDDSGASIKNPYPSKGQSFGDVLKSDYATRGGEARTINDLLSHQKLQDDYADEMKLKLVSQAGGGGSFSGKGGNIALGNDLPMYDAKSTTLHELQHAIQQREGFARGGNPAQMEREQEAAYATIQDLNKNMSQVFTMMEEAKAAGDIGRVKYLKDQYDSLMGTRQELIPAAQADAYEAYKSLAGEAEARLTQARMNMTGAERAASYPPSMFDVPVKDQIVRFGDGQAMSIPKTQQSFEELMKDAEQAMIQNKVQKQPVKLRDLMAIGGALPAGVAGGYYGMSYLGDNQ